MRNSRGIACVLLCSIAGVASAKPPAKPAEPPRERVDDLEYQVVALQQLRELDLTPEQSAAVAAAAGKSAGKAAALPSQPAEYKAALSAYAEALAGGDEDKIDEAEAKVDDARESMKIDPPPEVSPTAGARAEADRIVGLLTAAQIAGYVAEHSDEVPDPVKTMVDAAEQARGADKGEYDALRVEAATQFGMLVAGVDPEAAAPVAAAAGNWLDKAKQMSDKEFESARPDLARQVRAMSNNVDAFAVLRHWMDREVVDLLSNPQLSAAAKRVKN